MVIVMYVLLVARACLLQEYLCQILRSGMIQYISYSKQLFWLASFSSGDIRSI